MGLVQGPRAMAFDGLFSRRRRHHDHLGRFALWPGDCGLDGADAPAFFGTRQSPGDDPAFRVRRHPGPVRPVLRWALQPQHSWPLVFERHYHGAFRHGGNFRTGRLQHQLRRYGLFHHPDALWPVWLRGAVDRPVDDQDARRTRRALPYLYCYLYVADPVHQRYLPVRAEVGRRPLVLARLLRRARQEMADLSAALRPICCRESPLCRLKLHMLFASTIHRSVAWKMSYKILPITKPVATATFPPSSR